MAFFIVQIDLFAHLISDLLNGLASQCWRARADLVRNFYNCLLEHLLLAIEWKVELVLGSLDKDAVAIF